MLRFLMLALCMKFLYDSSHSFKPLDEKLKEHVDRMRIQTPILKSTIREQLYSILTRSIKKHFQKRKVSIGDHPPNAISSSLSSSNSSLKDQQPFSSEEKLEKPGPIKRILKFDRSS